MTKDIFDMSNARIFKEIEKKMGDVYTLLCMRTAELSKAFCLRDLYYSEISDVKLLGYMMAGISRNLSWNKKKKYAGRPNAVYSNTCS